MKLFKWLNELEFKATGAFAGVSYLLWFIFLLDSLIRILEKVIK